MNIELNDTTLISECTKYTISPETHDIVVLCLGINKVIITRGTNGWQIQHTDNIDTVIIPHDHKEAFA